MRAAGPALHLGSDALEFERRVGRLVYVPVRELAHETQTLMLIGHERGTSAIASVLAEMLKAMMREAAA